MKDKFLIEVRIAPDTSTLANPFIYDNYTDSTFLTFLTPSGPFDCIVTETKVEDQMYYKKSIDEKIVISKASEYQVLLAELESSACGVYWVNVSVLCNGIYKFKHRFFFTKKSSSVDYDKCTITITLQVTSLYDAIDANKNIKYKFIQDLPLTFDNFAGSGTLYKIADLSDIVNNVIIFMGIGGYENNVVGSLECALSDFFNWKINNGPTYAGATTTGVLKDVKQIGGPGFTISPNYVDPTQDPYFIGIGIKSNIIDPGASNPAEFFEFSFSDIEKILREVFNVYWIIEENILFDYPSIGPALRYIRFEHYSWFQKNMNYDSTSVTNFTVNKGKNRYKNLLKENIGIEQWQFFDNVYTNEFIGNPILYYACSNSVKTRKRGLDNFGFDFEAVQAGYATDNNGYMLFDVFFVVEPHPRTILLRTDTVNGIGYLNGRLSTYDLLPKLHKYNRPYKSGVVNGASTLFLSPVYDKEQEDIIVESCCTDPEYNKTFSSVKTLIGEGEIVEAKTNYHKGIITFKINNQ